MTAIMAVCMLGAHAQEWFRGVYSETYGPLLAYARRRVDHATADEADRDVLMLVAWEELSHAEIGQVLGISANALATRVHRARKRLAAHQAVETTIGVSDSATSQTTVTFDFDDFAEPWELTIETTFSDGNVEYQVTPGPALEDMGSPQMDTYAEVFIDGQAYRSVADGSWDGPIAVDSGTGSPGASIQSNLTFGVAIDDLIRRVSYSATIDGTGSFSVSTSWADFGDAPPITAPTN